MVSVAVIVPYPGKVQAITVMLTPTNLKHAHSFLQTCSWFRRFSPNFADVSRPLSNLLKKECTTLKNCLATAPVLRQPDPSKLFTLRTDASFLAIGTALLQGEESEELPVEYSSRLLTTAQRNYTTTEGEALAIVCAISKFYGSEEAPPASVAPVRHPGRSRKTPVQVQ